MKNFKVQKVGTLLIKLTLLIFSTSLYSCSKSKMDPKSNTGESKVKDANTEEFPTISLNQVSVKIKEFHDIYIKYELQEQRNKIRSQPLFLHELKDERFYNLETRVAIYNLIYLIELGKKYQNIYFNLQDYDWTNFLESNFLPEKICKKGYLPKLNISENGIRSYSYYKVIFNDKSECFEEVKAAQNVVVNLQNSYQIVNLRKLSNLDIGQHLLKESTDEFEPFKLSAILADISKEDLDLPKTYQIQFYSSVVKYAELFNSFEISLNQYAIYEGDELFERDRSIEIQNLVQEYLKKCDEFLLQEKSLENPVTGFKKQLNYIIYYVANPN